MRDSSDSVNIKEKVGGEIFQKYHYFNFNISPSLAALQLTDLAADKLFFTGSLKGGGNSGGGGGSFGNSGGGGSGYGGGGSGGGGGNGLGNLGGGLKGLAGGGGGGGGLFGGLKGMITAIAATVYSFA